MQNGKQNKPPVKKDLLVLENKYHLGDEFYKNDGSIDHRGLIIDRLFQSDSNTSKGIKQKEKPNYGLVDASSRSDS